MCEKIPTLGTQLRVMSTVKATMMTNTIDTEEDADAMDEDDGGARDAMREAADTQHRQTSLRKLHQLREFISDKNKRNMGRVKELKVAHPRPGAFFRVIPSHSLMLPQT